MQQVEPQPGAPIGSLDWRKILPFEPAVSSDRLGWVGLGLGAAHCRSERAFERISPAITHHRLVLNARPPEELDLQYDGVKRHAPHPPGSITLVPASRQAWVRSSGHKNELHVFLDPRLVTRVAEEVFDLDPARLTVPPLDGLSLPQLRAVMGAIEVELMTADGAGSRLAAESLANLLSVHLIRHILRPHQFVRAPSAALSREKLRDVVEYLEEHLGSGLTLERIAAVVHLSPYHFARQFKAATGVPPHQYVITRRIERARELLCMRNVSLAEVAMSVGFSDQSQLTRHFKRVLNVTPGQFRKSARTT
jgi:AraC family transcriptional regulator